MQNTTRIDQVDDVPNLLNSFDPHPHFLEAPPTVLKNSNTVFISDAGLGETSVEQLVSLYYLHLPPKSGNTSGGQAVGRIREQIFAWGKIMVWVLVDVHSLEDRGVVHRPGASGVNGDDPLVNVTDHLKCHGVSGGKQREKSEGEITN